MWVKTKSKEPPKWVDTFLNYFFVCLKDHKWSIIVRIVIIFLGIFFIKWKFCMFKVWHKSKMFLHVQNTQTSRMDFFFSNVIFLPNVHHSFWKLKRILTLTIRREKWFEPMIFFITHLSKFGSKTLLTLKIMDFENLFLTKVVHIYVIKGMNAQYTWYKINL